MAKSMHYRIRKWHRYLGVILGIQFLLWTLGGLYFSWSNLDEVHGDPQKAAIVPLRADIQLVSPQIALDKLREKDSVNVLHGIRLIQVLGEPFYQINYATDAKNQPKIQLADARTGTLRPPLTEAEAMAVAQAGFAPDAAIGKVEYLTNTNGHHEYREQPLPAYAVTFNHPSRTTVYVASELGTIEKFRNNQWRVFDFLWMLHTMDYQNRDNISNWLLRAFSVFGLLTVFSGFALYFVSKRKGFFSYFKPYAK